MFPQNEHLSEQGRCWCSGECPCDDGKFPDSSADWVQDLDGRAVVSAISKSNWIVRESAVDGIRAGQVRGRNQLRFGIWMLLGAVFAFLTFLGMVFENSVG